MNPLEALPDDWKITVTRVTAGGRGADGRWVEGQRTTIEGCVFGSGELTEDGRFSSLPAGEGVLYAPAASEWTDKDSVITPPGSPIPGTWNVVGDPVRWPYGWQIRLQKGDSR